MATKYETIAHDIRSRIESGELGPGDALPTTAQLCAQYAVSKITVKHAMDDLVAEGLVARRRGAGTFVQTRPTGEAARVTSAEVHVFSPARPDAHVADKLRLAEDEFCFYLARTCYAEDEPYCVEYAFLPIAVASGLRRHHAEVDLYASLERDLGVRVATSHEVVRAVRPNAQEAAWLKTDEHAALVRVTALAFTDDGRTVAYVSRLHAPGYVYVSVSKR